jgi:pimeloyl-ACP methyl ester carboxylesterase
VLFIHGTAASIWGELFDRVATTNRAIRYDRRGFGASRHGPIHDLSVHANDAAGLLNALDAREAVVVGWSIGGIIAAELAIRQPALVRGLVLLEPPLWAKKHPDLNLFNGVVLSIVWGMLSGPARGGRRFSRWVFRERSGGNSLLTAGGSVQDQIIANEAAIGQEIRGGTGEHLSEADLAAIRVPTHILVGDRSQEFFALGGRRIASAIPHSQLSVLTGASHFLQLEFAEHISGVIAGLANPQ